MCVQVVGRVVRDCVSSGGSVWLMARALDTLYDLFGADECPVSIFTHLQIMPILKTIAAHLPEKVRLLCSVFLELFLYLSLTSYFLICVYIYTHVWIFCAGCYYKQEGAGNIVWGGSVCQRQSATFH